MTTNNKTWITRCDCETEEKSMWSKVPDAAIEDVLGAGRVLVDRKFLPKITNFIIVGLLYYAKPKCNTFQNLFKADVLSELVTSYPLATTNSSPQCRCWLRFADPHTHHEVDLVAIDLEMMDMVEGYPWTQYRNGVRLPKSIQLRNHQPQTDPTDPYAMPVYGLPYYIHQHQFNPQEWYAKAVRDAQQFRSEFPTPLFYWEDRARRSLVHVRTDSELVVPRIIRREKPLEELQLDINSGEARVLKDIWRLPNSFCC